MSLQTAPLGQLSGLNLPYSVPRYEKPKSILQQALAAALVNVASNVGRNVGDNLTTRDYATEADGGKAGFMSKLLSGPKVNEKTNQQRQAYAHEDELTRGNQNFTAAQNELNRSQDTNRDFSRQSHDAEMQKERLTAQQAGDDRQAALALSRQQMERRARELELVARNGQEAALQAGQAYDRAHDPQNVAQARLQNAEASRIERFLQGAASGNQPQVQGQPQVDPSLLRDRQAQAQLPSPEFVQAQVNPNTPSSNNPDLAMIEQFMGKGLVPSTTAPQEAPVVMPQVSVSAAEQPYVEPSELFAQLTGASPSPGQPNVPAMQALMQLIQNIQSPNPKQVKKPANTNYTFQGYPSN